MKQFFYISFFVFGLFFSCSSKNNADNANLLDDVDEEQTSATDSKAKGYDANTSLILLGKKGYKTYSNHWAYLSDDEYLATNQKQIVHFDDTISIGMLNNEDQCGLVDSLRLNKEWLCINFSDSDTINTYSLSKAITKSYSYNDVIDFVPITVVVFQKNEREELCGTDLAFRGDYKKTDFLLSHKQQLSDSEQQEVISALRNKVRDVNAIPPRPMASDTLLLQEIYKVGSDIVVAKYNTTQYSDSDGDFGNQTIFVLKKNEVVNWLGGMDIYCVPFELKGVSYLYINENTYATSRTTLLRLTDDVKAVYKKVLFFD